MRFDLKILKNLSVETQSGTKLGNVYDLVLETSGQMIAQYLVKLSVMSRTVYRISRDQVVKFTEKKLVVDDGVVKEKKSTVLARRKTAVATAMMRE